MFIGSVAKTVLMQRFLGLSRCHSFWYDSINLEMGEVERMKGDVFKGRLFEAEIILLSVRWVKRYAAELGRRIRPHLSRTNDSWRLDETYS
jgi:transposase-like protein